MHEGQAIAAQPLKDKALPTEKTCAEFFGKGDINIYARCRAQKRILLTDNLTTMFTQIKRHHLARIGGGKGDMPLARSFMDKACDKESLARQHALEAGKQPATGTGLHGDAIAHIHHGASFCPDALARIEFDFNQLHLFAMDRIIDHVCHLGVSCFSELTVLYGQVWNLAVSIARKRGKNTTSAPKVTKDHQFCRTIRETETPSSRC